MFYYRYPAIGLLIPITDSNTHLNHVRVLICKTILIFPVRLIGLYVTNIPFPPKTPNLATSLFCGGVWIRTSPCRSTGTIKSFIKKSLSLPRQHLSAPSGPASSPFKTSHPRFFFHTASGLAVCPAVRHPREGTPSGRFILTSSPICQITLSCFCKDTIFFPKSEESCNFFCTVWKT